MNVNFLKFINKCTYFSALHFLCFMEQSLQIGTQNWFRPKKVGPLAFHSWIISSFPCNFTKRVTDETSKLPPTQHQTQPSLSAINGSRKSHPIYICL